MHNSLVSWFDDIVIDVHGSIIDSLEKGDDYKEIWQSVSFLNTSAVKNSVDAIKYLCDVGLRRQIVLIFSGQKLSRKKTLLWLVKNRFFQYTGMSRGQVLFGDNHKKKVSWIEKVKPRCVVSRDICFLGDLVGVSPFLYLLNAPMNKLAEGLSLLRFFHDLPETWQNVVDDILLQP